MLRTTGSFEHFPVHDGDREHGRTAELSSKSRSTLMRLAIAWQERLNVDSAMRIGGLAVIGLTLIALSAVGHAADPIGPPLEAAEQRDADEYNLGLASEDGIVDVLKRFNAESILQARRSHVSPTQPPLTEAELLTALRWAVEGGDDHPSGLVEKCQQVVATKRLPRGSRLYLGLGLYRPTRNGGDIRSRQPDIAMWRIELHFSLREVPPQLSKDRILVRLTFLNSR